MKYLIGETVKAGPGLVLVKGETLDDSKLSDEQKDKIKELHEAGYLLSEKDLNKTHLDVSAENVGTGEKVEVEKVDDHSKKK